MEQEKGKKILHKWGKKSRSWPLPAKGMDVNKQEGIEIIIRKKKNERKSFDKGTTPVLYSIMLSSDIFLCVLYKSFLKKERKKLMYILPIIDGIE